MSDEQKLTAIDPEGEACFSVMVEIIAEEIRARVAVHDNDTLDPTWASRVTAVAADALLDGFMVRPRTSGEPRWQRD